MPVFRRSYIEVDLTGSNAPETVKACTSMEGVHFTIWPGRPLRGKPLLHLYVPLGYDVTPSCTAAETGS